MLQALREKSSGWIATVILALLIVPFAFFGMEQYLFQRNETFVAKIEAPPAWWPSAPDVWPVRKLLWKAEEIGADEFRSSFELVRQRQRQMQGESFDARQFESIDNKRKVLDELIDQRVMRMAAQREGFEVGDALVRKTIEEIPAFQVDGKFDPQRYRLQLASQVPKRTPTQFDAEIRKELQQTMLRNQLQGSAFVTASEAQRLLGLLTEKRDVSYAIVPAPAADSSAIPAADIARWYKEHQEDFRAPETVTIEYLDIDGNALPAPAPADEGILLQRYEQEKARFVEPEQRLTSHILIKADEGADPAAQKAAEAKAQDLAKQARAGADFAALARQHSEDEGSKGGGGDLGWISKNGAMVKPFEDAVFAMNGPGVSAPVKSDFGWHVIQVREVKPGSTVPFEAARAELEKVEAESARERAFNEIVGKVVDEVLKSPTVLAPAARVAGLQVQKLGPFARGKGAGIAANAAVQRAAFSELAIQNRIVSDAIEIGPNHSVLIRVVEHVPEQVQPLAQVGDRVVAAIRADRAQKATEADAEAVVGRIRKGESLATIANDRKWILTNFPAVPRGAPAPDAEAVEAYFSTPAPAEGKVSPGKVTLQNGMTIVFAVTKVVRGDTAEVTPEQRAAFLQELAPVVGELDVTALGKAQRRQAKVTIAEERL